LEQVTARDQPATVARQRQGSQVRSVRTRRQEWRAQRARPARDLSIERTGPWVRIRSAIGLIVFLAVLGSAIAAILGGGLLLLDLAIRQAVK
jgi:hypothetical protein